jgi:CRISPR system Cascade subunit CasA
MKVGRLHFGLSALSQSVAALPLIERPSMPELYSLVRRAWLPVAFSNGRRDFVRLIDIADGSIIRIATGRPDCDISLTEFLIGLLAVAIGPRNDEDWAGRYLNAPTSADLEAAFAPFDSALILDGEGSRFFQDREAFEGAATPVEAFLMDAPAEHFQVDGRTQVLSRAGAAIALATLQTSAPAGGAGHRTSLRGGGPLSNLVVPGTADQSEPTLWQRLWANVPGDDYSATADEAGRVFPWLSATRVSDKEGKATNPTDVHLAQAFFGMPRRIRLVFEPNTDHRPCDLTGATDDVIVTGYVTKPWGTNYTGWSRAHPLSPYYKVKPADIEFLPVHLKSSRVGYRQWLGMVMDAKEGQRVRARCLATFERRTEELPEIEATIVKRSQLLVAGYAMDNMKPLDFAESLLPLIITKDATVNDAIKQLARSWVGAADTVASQLVTSVKIALFGENAKADRDSTRLDAVKSRFWADTEDEFYVQLRAAADTFEQSAASLADTKDDLNQAAGAKWLASLNRHALIIFDDAVPIEDADGDRIQDIIAGRRMLGLMLTGFGKGGQALFGLLGQKPDEAKPKKGPPKGKKAA